MFNERKRVLNFEFLNTVFCCVRCGRESRTSRIIRESKEFKVSTRLLFSDVTDEDSSLYQTRTWCIESF